LSKSPRGALQRQAAIAVVGRADQVLVNAPLQAPITEPSADRVSKLAPPGFGQALQYRQEPPLWKRKRRRKNPPRAMIEILTMWLNSLPAWALALVLCAFFLTITLAGIVLIHPLMRRAIHSERQANDVVIFAAANYGLIYAVLLGRSRPSRRPKISKIILARKRRAYRQCTTAPRTIPSRCAAN
jgi:hypothetical protein